MSMFRRRLLMQQALRVPAFPEIPGLIARYSARGLTNEEMAKTNVWKDLTGNGHDIALNNFAWTEESGISTVNYPNALVSDGVDDYGICENFPILTKEKGYTVVALRKWLIVKSATALVTNSSSVSDNGAFMMEINHNSCGSFSPASNLVTVNDNNFVYQKSTSYNGQTIQTGDDEGTNILNLFRNIPNGNFYTSVALYDLLIYSRDLTEEEIGKIKTYFAKIHPDLSIN